MIKLKDIAQEYLRSFPLLEKEEEDGSSRRAKAAKKYREIRRLKDGKLSIDDIKEMDKREQVDIALNKVLSKSALLEQELTKCDENVLDPYTWQDLNLIAGNVTTPDKNVLAYIKRNQTVVGGCVMATQMVNPTTDIHEIKDQQAVTKYLLARPKVAAAINHHVTKIARHERVGLSLWKNENDLTHKEYKKELNSFYYKLFGLNKKGTSTWLLQCTKWWKDLWLQPMLGFWTLVFLGYMVFNGIKVPRQIYHLQRLFKTEDSYQEMIKSVPSSWWKCISHFYLRDTLFPGISFFKEEKIVWEEETLQLIRNVSPSTKSELVIFPTTYELISGIVSSGEPLLIKIIVIGTYLVPSLLGLYTCYRAYSSFLKNRSTLNFLAAHLVPIQDLVLSAKRISSIVAGHKVLEKHYGHKLRATRALLAGEGISADARQLLYNLQVLTLHNRWYFFSNTGRLLATYKLFRKHKRALVDLYYEMGLVDAQLSVYHVMVQGRDYDEHNRFVFGELHEAVDNNSVLEMKRMWHLGLDAKRAVSNDVYLRSKGGPRTEIVTGPNAGGKSTYILGAGINAVLNQVYGIAAAGAAVQSIFYKIITYVNPTQNLAAGLSLAEAGMAVLQEHKNIFMRVDKPILAIIDEILNGTDPKIAADYSYKILQHRNATYANCLTLLTTHYMNLPALADESPLVKNRKVVVVIPGSNGRRFDYTYKIEDGVSDQNIVGDMLMDKGII